MGFNKRNLDRNGIDYGFAPTFTSKLVIDEASYAKLDFQDNCSRYAASGNLLLGKYFNMFLLKKIYLPVICCILFTIVFCLTINKFFVGLALISLIILTLITITVFIRRIIFYFIKPKKILRMIKKTDCYKGIISKINESNLGNIAYIYSNKCRIVLCDQDGKRINIAFNKFDFPNLSIDKQPLLLAGIINDLYKRDKRFYKISNKVKDAGLCLFDCDDENFRYKKNDYNFENLFVAINSKYFVKNEG